MTSPPRLVGSDDQEQLRELLERSVAELRGPDAAVAGISRASSASASSYAAETVTVELVSGATVTFFLKDFGATSVPKDQPLQRRERELAAYRDFLSASDLGTARYFGSVWKPDQERFWMLLELVPGTPVRQSTFDAWLAAAAWLGRLQGFFARHSERVAGCDLLLHYDADFLWSRAELATRQVADISVHMATGLRASLVHYKPAVPRMLSWPPTLVHGHYRPYNILVDVTSEPPRVCPVDWERVGLGPPAYDFAYLAEGFDSERLDRLGAAYRAEATRHGVSVPDPKELRYLANAFRVHRMLSLLGSAAERGFTGAEVVKLVSLVSQLCERL
jgi:phosphotransferase family enzyme